MCCKIPLSSEALVCSPVWLHNHSKFGGVSDASMSSIFVDISIMSLSVEVQRRRRHNVIVQNGYTTIVISRDQRVSSCTCEEMEYTVMLRNPMVYAPTSC